MEKVVLIICSLLVSLNIFAQTHHDQILGKWTNEDQTRIIEFVKNGETYDAIIRKATDNSLVGKKQITGLKPSSKQAFINGTVHLIKRGKTAKCSAELSGNNKLYLKANLGITSKTQTWKKL